PTNVGVSACNRVDGLLKEVDYLPVGRDGPAFLPHFVEAKVAFSNPCPPPKKSAFLIILKAPF
ncbi:MAG: hypothetical protein PHV61_10895, partial [Limnochordia bacterium]|nr:hypothetical protein [Limnochordia bacterium]